MKKKKIDISQIIVISILTFICVLWIFPLIYIILTSFRTDKSIMFEGFSFFPTKWTTSTYEAVLANTSDAPIVKWFINSFVSLNYCVLIICSVWKK